jgi:energy-coupling factor transport system substrate-specific component
LFAKITSEFTTLTLTLMSVAIAINIVLGQVAQNVLKLPIYLDSLGTILVATLAGPWAGAVTGALSNILWGIIFSSPQSIPFAITAFVIGLMAGFLALRGWLKPNALVWVVLGGALTGLVAAVVSAPIAAYVFGGVTGSGTDLIVAYFQATGANILQATLGQGIISDPFDKTVSFVSVWLLLRGLPARNLARFPHGQNALRSDV